MRFVRRFWIALFVLAMPQFAGAQQPRIDPAGIRGAVLLAGSYQLSDQTCDRFIELAGGAKAKIVIIIAGERQYGRPPVEQLTAAAKKKDAAAPIVVTYEKASQAIASATGVWLHLDSTSSWYKAIASKSISNECQQLLSRGGAVGTAQAGVSFVGSEFLVRNAGCKALGLIPDSLIDVVKPGKLASSPFLDLEKKLMGIVGFELDRDVTMIVKGRTISTLGAGRVQAYVTSGKAQWRFVTIQGKSQEDLTALRRSARDCAERFPPKQPEQPFVEKGTLVIVGGGGSPVGLYPRFVELAGGKDKAKIVIFPTANADPIPKRDFVAQTFLKAGAKKATILYGRTQAEVESKEFLDTLKDATGLWFDGGRQWRFVDCYEHTKAMPLMFDVLKRGGVIGGTSAGASIQGDYLARGGVFNNVDIRYEGYERGLGFLKGVAIDQHFTQRKRQTDMTKLMKIHPQFLGIGIDEATAIVVQRSTAEVIGKGRVFFYDTHRKAEPDGPDYVALPAGGRYDLKDRKVLAK